MCFFKYYSCKIIGFIKLLDFKMLNTCNYKFSSVKKLNVTIKKELVKVY